MRRWNGKSFLALLLVLGLAVAAITAGKRRGDPMYKGKRLSEHLARVRPGGFSYGGMGIRNGEYPAIPEPPQVEYECVDVDALDAISKEGTNALPMLVRMLRSRDSAAQMWFYSYSQKHQRIAKLFRPKPPHAFTDQVRAAAVFYRLGASAAQAVPAVVPLLRNQEQALAALAVLSVIRPTRSEDILAITNVLNLGRLPSTFGPASELHSAAILALASFGSQAQGAAGVLMEALSSTNSLVRGASGVALARLHAEPERIVPKILDEVTTLAERNRKAVSRAPMLSHFDERCLALNLWSLGEYGRSARVALPTLTNLQSYPLGNIQRLAWDVAAKIKKDTNSIAR